MVNTDQITTSVVSELNLSDFRSIQTTGFYNPGDGGGALWYLKTRRYICELLMI